MDRTVLSVLVLLFSCVCGLPQVREIYYRRTTTQDPVQAFFSSCDPRSASCVQSQNCRYENILNEGTCSTFGQVCCKTEDTPIVFPEHPSPRPVIRPTTPSTTTTTRTVTRKKTKPATTTEEPYTGFQTADCGVRQSNLSQPVDLRDTERGEFPWIVGVFSKIENDFGTVQDVFQCGGTLIDDYVVVTSANCENLRSTAELFIYAAVWNLEDGEEKRQIRKVARIIKHPRFVQGTRVASIALLILDDLVDFTPHVNRICLPDIHTDFSDSTCFVTGWGGTPDSGQTIRPYMKVVEMQLTKREECVKAMRRTVPKYELNESFQCAQEESENHICPFDVGSPLFCTIPGREQQFYQVGIFAWNPFVDRHRACNEANGIVNLFVKVQHFRKWIDNEMEKLERDTNIYIPQPEDNEESQHEF